MKISKKTVCAPIATLTLIGSLIGGANAATLVTWTVINPITAIATMSDSTFVTAIASTGGSFTYSPPLAEMGDSTWSDDLGNSFFPTVSSGNGLNFVHDGSVGSRITFSFSPSNSNPELWYSNAREDFILSSAFAAVALDQAAPSGLTINNFGTNVVGPDPIQSAGRLTITGDVTSFSIDIPPSPFNELVRFAIVDEVPEPSSTALLGLGGLALLARRKRS